MAIHHVYANDTFPPHLLYQRIAFIRLLWEDSYAEMPPHLMPLDPRYVRHEVYAEGDALVSSASVIKTTVFLGEIDLTCYGLSGVMTYPYFRKRGFGGDLRDRVTAFIEAQPDADLGLLWTSVAPFYEVRGWKSICSGKRVFGDRAKPTVRDETTMMLFLSEKARSLRDELEQGRLYIGERDW